jgi:hypothetical protein
MTQIKLSGIYTYPIKSAGGIALKTARVEQRGFQYDRRWMLVDETGKFLSQRQFPRMALISVLVEGDKLVVKAPNTEPLSIALNLDRGEASEELAKPSGSVLVELSSSSIPVRIWNDVCDAIPVAEEVSQWFSEFLKTSCRLVYMPESSLRPVNPDYAIRDESVSFADGFPFLLISEASLQDLNERLDEPVSMNRFRPNLVVSGCEAFAEDTWRQIRIGAIAFDVVKPCARCIVTTIDQTQGIRGKEPLATLARYRRQDGDILFGQNLIPGNLGTLQLGDSVEIV